MYKVFWKAMMPIFVFSGVLVVLFSSESFVNWFRSSQTNLLLVIIISILAFVLLSYKVYKILDNVKRYGTKEEQVMDMRFREMMKSEGEFSKEAVEKFFPEIANEDKIK